MDNPLKFPSETPRKKIQFPFASKKSEPPTLTPPDPLRWKIFWLSSAVKRRDGIGNPSTPWMRKRGGTGTSPPGQPCGSKAKPLGEVFTYLARPILKKFSRMEFSRGNLLPGVPSKGWQSVINSNPLKNRRKFPLEGFSVSFPPPRQFFPKLEFSTEGQF